VDVLDWVYLTLRVGPWILVLGFFVFYLAVKLAEHRPRAHKRPDGPNTLRPA
jgi:hypothetical protein